MSLVGSVWGPATVTCSLPVTLWLALCWSTPWLSRLGLIALIKMGTRTYWVFWDRLRTLKAKPLHFHCRFVFSVPLVLTDVWTCLTMQQSVKPLWVRGGSLSHMPNLKGISEFQLPLKIMSSKHANLAICSVLEPCLPQLSWELGVYAQFGVQGICDILSVEN